METITKIPGLQHISEDIFKLLDKKSLINCRKVNSSWKYVLDRPIFWLKKLKSENPPLDIQKSWENLAQELEEDDEKMAKEFVLILTKIISGRKIIISPYQSVSDLMNSNKYVDLVKFILEHENPMSKLNRVYLTGKYLNNKFTILEDATPIHMASLYGFTEVVKKLTRVYRKTG